MGTKAPLGAAFSHARASGKDQSQGAQRRRANAFLRRNGHPTMSAKVAKGILDRWRAMTTDERADQYNLQAAGISPEVARALAMQGNGKAPKRKPLFGNGVAKTAYASAYRKAARDALDPDVDAALHRKARASAGGQGARVANRGRASEGSTALLNRARRMQKRAAAMLARVDKGGPTLGETSANGHVNGFTNPKRGQKKWLLTKSVDAIIKSALAPVAKGGPGSGPKPGGGGFGKPTAHGADSHLAAAERHIQRARQARAAGDHANADKHTVHAHDRMKQALGASTQRLQKAGTFNESDHPRADNGEFGEGSGGAGATYDRPAPGKGSGAQSTPTQGKARVSSEQAAAAMQNPKPARNNVKAPHPKQSKPASDEEIATAVKDYTNVGFYALNEQAKNYDTSKPKTKQEKTDRRRAEALSQGINKSPLSKDTTMYRGFAIAPGAKVGDILENHGFTSASTSKAVANRFAKKAAGGNKESVVATIRAPKGTPALDVASRSEASQGGSEKEFIFDHQTRFRVVEDGGQGAGGHRHLTLEPVRNSSSDKKAPSDAQKAIASLRKSVIQKRHMVAQLADQYVAAAYAPPQTPGPEGGFEDRPDCAHYLDAQRLVAGMDQESNLNAEITPTMARARASGALATDMGAYDRVVAGPDRALAGVGGLNLDLGSGQARQRGFLGIDVYPYDYGTVLHDLGLGIPFPDGSARAVRLNNALAGLDDYRDDPTPLLEEVQRVLAIGGRFYYTGQPIQSSVDWSKLPGLGVVSHQFGDGGTVLNLTLARVPAKLPLVYGADVNFLSQNERFPADLALSQATFGAVPSADVAMANLVHKREHVDVRARVVKAEAYQHKILGVILSPEECDSQGDVISAEEIEKTAHDFLVNARVVGREHTEIFDGATVIESYIAPMDMDFNDPLYGPQSVKKGSWVVGVQLPEEEFAGVLDGTYTGFSVGGWGEREDLPAA